jgi:hypothetical protein
LGSVGIALAGCGGAAEVAGSAADAGPPPSATAPATPTPPASTGAAGGSASPDAAPPDAGPPDAGACVDDLSNVGTADFTIAFKVKTTQTGLVTLVYQRATCDRGLFWDVRLNPGGILGAEIDNGTSHYTVVFATTPIDDGAVHTVVVKRVSQIISVTIDGIREASGSALANLGTLPRLGSVSGDPCERVDGTTILTGTLTDLCVSTP